MRSYHPTSESALESAINGGGQWELLAQRGSYDEAKDFWHWIRADS